MHDRNSDPRQATACDDTPDHLVARLRYAADVLAYAASGKWLLVRLAILFVFLANLRAHLQHGRTAIVRPSRTGGVDYSARAVLRQRNPMVFGGLTSFAGATCGTVKVARVRVAVRPNFAEVRAPSGTTHLMLDGWVATRRVVAAMFPLRWPADCGASEVPQ